MIKAVFAKIKSLFKKKDDKLFDINVSVQSNTKKIKKSKKLKNSTDNSVDNSNNVAGNQDNSTHENNFYVQSATKDLIVSARWVHLVPYKIERVNNGIDCFNLLMPIDKNYIKPNIAIDFDNTKNTKNGLYILVKANSFVKNLILKSVSLKLDTCSFSLVESKNIFGLLDKDRCFTILDGNMRIGNGTIALEFGFEYEKRHYTQSFVFTAKNNSDEFILEQYIEPELDEDITLYGI